MSLWAVIPAAGAGSRMGSATPKQYLPLHGRAILSWSIEALLACERLRGCMVALAADDELAGTLSLFEHPRVQRCVGGLTRAQSVANGIRALNAAADDWVLVHDAARPCLPASAVNRLVDSVLDSGVGGLLAQPQTDTLKRADDSGRVLETLPREGLWRAQTPQMFRVGELLQALQAARDDGAEVTDEASAMERMGYAVQVVEGPACNLKVTYADDLQLASHWLAREAAPGSHGGDA
jgi:2-C-methyl-D-erythritol 4-phosphate cytidylyltransferase